MPALVQDIEPVDSQSLKKLSFKSLKRALDLLSPIHDQLAPPDPERLQKIPNFSVPSFLITFFYFVCLQ